MGRVCNMHGRNEKCTQGFTRKSGMNRPLRRPRRRREDKDLKEIG
jgi:hypothetical protein